MQLKVNKSFDFVKEKIVVLSFSVFSLVLNPRFKTLGVLTGIAALKEDADEHWRKQIFCLSYLSVFGVPTKSGPAHLLITRKLSPGEKRKIIAILKKSCDIITVDKIGRRADVSAQVADKKCSNDLRNDKSYG